jgi:hypothetical protein
MRISFVEKVVASGCCRGHHLLILLIRLSPASRHSQRESIAILNRTGPEGKGFSHETFWRTQRGVACLTPATSAQRLEECRPRHCRPAAMAATYSKLCLMPCDDVRPNLSAQPFATFKYIPEFR